VQDSETEGLKVLWDQIKSRLATLWRVKHIQKQGSKKEKKWTRLFQDPFKYAQSILEE